MSADILLLLNHNEWANNRLIKLTESLPADEPFHRAFPMGEGSFHATLIHIAGAMAHWSDRLDDRIPGEPIEDQQFTINQLQPLFDTSHKLFKTIVHEIIATDRLDEMMVHPEAPKPFTRRVAIHHVLTHSGHHRAQALNMLRHILNTTDLPDTDVIEHAIGNAIFSHNQEG